MARVGDVASDQKTSSVPTAAAKVMRSITKPWLCSPKPMRC
jgi:hypothetical protein